MKEYINSLQFISDKITKEISKSKYTYFTPKKRMLTHLRNDIDETIQVYKTDMKHYKIK